MLFRIAPVPKKPPQKQRASIMFKNYRDKCEKRRCSCSHKQCKTLLKDRLVWFKIISLHIYKDLRLRILGIMTHATI